MASPIPQQVIDQIEKTKGVVASATDTITHIKDRIQTAIEVAMQNGATAEQLAPLTDEVVALGNSTDALAAAIAANADTPPANP